jgi:acylphosphatase
MSNVLKKKGERHMNKCLKITVLIDPLQSFSYDMVQKFARKYQLEGVVQLIDKSKIKIIVSGEKKQVDTFIDTIQKESAGINIQDLEIEPQLKDRDFRGVFRIIQ